MNEAARRSLGRALPSAIPDPRAGVREGKQWVQDYVVPARPEDTVLDCLLKVKRTIDPTLAFRYSCGHGMCGSDAVSINGTPTLLCTATVKAWAKQPSDAQVDEDGFRHTGEDVQPAQTQDADDLGVIELASAARFPRAA